MELEIKHCRLVVAIADTGGLPAAARTLGLSVDAATSALRRVEQLVGSPVFDRSVEPWTATERGVGLVQRARRVLGTAESLTAQVRRLQEGSTVLRVRAAVLPFEVLLPALRARFPQQEWSVTADTLASGLEAVTAGEADLVYGLRPAGEAPVERPGVAAQDLLTEQTALLAPAWHPWGDSGEVELARLSRSPWVVPADPVVEHGLQLACRKAGFEPDIAYRLGHSSLINGIVAAGGGAVAAVSPVWKADQRNVVLRCPGLPTFTWLLAHRTDRVPPEMASAIVQITRTGYRAVASLPPGRG